VRLLTQAWVDDLARGIAAHPQDWHMLQKIWVSDLDADRYAATVATPERGA
jgi:lauroyl/myristoyl acyltransferase